MKVPATEAEARAWNREAREVADRNPVALTARLAALPWLAEQLAPLRVGVADALDVVARRGIHAGRPDIDEGWQLHVARWAVEELAKRPGGDGLSLLAAAMVRLLPRKVRRARGNAGRYPAVLAQARDGFGRARDVLPPLSGRVIGDTVQYSLIPDLGEYDEYGGEFLVSALPVALYETPGRGAPLAMRIALESILDVRTRDRDGRTVTLEGPWGKVVDAIYPGRYYHRGKLFPGLQRALEELKRDPRWTDIPVANGKGGWEAWHVVDPVRRPLTGHKSEVVRFAVSLPASGKRGGIADRQLVREAGAKSLPALALATGFPILWDNPDELRAHVGGKGWEQLDRIDAYPLLSLRAVVGLMYPDGPPKRKRWPVLLDEARKLLDWLAAREAVTWQRDWGGRRIMPGAKWPGWTADQRKLIAPPK